MNDAGKQLALKKERIAVLTSTPTENIYAPILLLHYFK
jgi:hypothetical protein